ncbi:MAG: PadR family transcriptional regulator [Hyphomicrobiales bacterium]
MNTKNSRKKQSIIDMVVLGILTKQPMNAYALAQYVEHNNVTRLVKLSTPAIYKSCKRLYEQNCLAGELKRDGEAPEKTLYRVSAIGKARFDELMSHFASHIAPFYFDINSVVYSLEGMEFEPALQLIDTYTAEIKAMQAWLIPHSKEDQANATFAARMIVKQYVMTVDVLVRWIDEFREEYIKAHK